MVSPTKHPALAAVLLATMVFGNSGGGFAETRYRIPLEGSPSIGPEQAPVVLVEFLDYQ